MVCRALCAGLVAASVAALAQSPALSQTPAPAVSPAVAQAVAVIRARTDLVHFGVSVTDRRGGAVTGLAATDFEIVEDGVPQVISTFASGTGDTASDLHLGVMFDSSESMRASIDAARTAAIRVLNRLEEAELVTLVEFDDSVRLSQFSPHDFPRLVERIRGGKPAGSTALYDAFATYLEQADGTTGRHVLVAFTDGGNSSGRTSYSHLTALARASQATIYVVGLLEHVPIGGRAEFELRLRRIAEETGGRAVFPLSMKQIDAAYDRIVDEVRSQYSLGYASSNPNQDGQWREVRLRLVRPEHKDLRVRTRAGYYAPLPSP
jgi:Ca-activated chloride channel family protein